MARKPINGLLDTEQCTRYAVRRDARKLRVMHELQAEMTTRVFKLSWVWWVEKILSLVVEKRSSRNSLLH